MQKVVKGEVKDKVLDYSKFCFVEGSKKPERKKLDHEEI